MTDSQSGATPDTSRPPRRRGVGPFSGRQLLGVAVAVVIAIVVLVVVTRPLGSTGVGLGPPDPRATPFVVGPSPSAGLRPGELAPELEAVLGDGTTWTLTDLDGRPLQLADLRGKAVWLNFWASWCPPCQAETPILRDLAARYRERGLAVVGVSVQESNAADVAAYAERYQLGYPIGADVSGHIFRLYRLWGLPTSFFIDPDGVIQSVQARPLDEAGARAIIEFILPKAGASTSGSPAPSASPTPSAP